MAAGPTRNVFFGGGAVGMCECYDGVVVYLSLYHDRVGPTLSKLRNAKLLSVYGRYVCLRWVFGRSGLYCPVVQAL